MSSWLEDILILIPKPLHKYKLKEKRENSII